MVYGSDMPVARLVDVVGSKLQTPTQIYYRRPFGVGLLIAGYDKQGPHIYQTCPAPATLLVNQAHFWQHLLTAGSFTSKNTALTI